MLTLVSQMTSFVDSGFVKRLPKNVAFLVVSNSPLRFSTACRLTLRNTSVSYSANTDGMVDARENAVIRETAIPLGYSTTSMKINLVLISISSSFTRHHNFSPGNKVQMQFVHEKPVQQHLYFSTF